LTSCSTPCNGNASTYGFVDFQHREPATGWGDGTLFAGETLGGVRTSAGLLLFRNLHHFTKQVCCFFAHTKVRIWGLEQRLEKTPLVCVI